MKNLIFLSIITALVMFITGGVVFCWLTKEYSTINWYAVLITAVLCGTLLICLTGLLIECIKDIINSSKRA